MGDEDSGQLIPSDQGEDLPGDPIDSQAALDLSVVMLDGDLSVQLIPFGNVQVDLGDGHCSGEMPVNCP